MDEDNILNFCGGKSPKFFKIKIIFYCFYFLLMGFGALLTIYAPFSLYYPPQKVYQNSSILGWSREQIELSPNGSVKIIDSKNNTTSFNMIEKLCSSQAAHKEDKCQLTLEVNSTQIESMIIICPSEGECQVNIESLNFSVKKLIIYGKKISLKAKLLNATNFFFDTIQGNIFIEKFLGTSAQVSTTQGDIIISTELEAKISTFSKSKSVCLTGSQGWKDLTTKENNLDEVFIEKDPKLQACLQLHSFEKRNYYEMIYNSKHVVFDSLIYEGSNTIIDSLCYEINDFMILNSPSINPSHSTSFVNIRAANLEGNIYINSGHLVQNHIFNSEYETTKLKISNKWIDKLNQTFQEITQQGRYNELVFLNFGFESQPDKVWVILFTPFYLHFSPKWVSMLSLFGLSSKQQLFNVEFSKGYYSERYNYESSEDIIKNDSTVSTLSGEQIQLEDTLKDFFKSINIEPFLMITLQQYDSFSIFDESTYPQNYEKIKQSNLVSSISKLIFWIIVIIQYLAFHLIFQSQMEKLTRFISTDQTKKVIYNLLQIIKPENKNKYQFPPTETTFISKKMEVPNQIEKNQVEISFKHRKETEEESLLNQREIIEKRTHKILPECNYEYGHFQVVLQTDIFYFFNLSELVSYGASWVQKNQINSLEFFYDLLFIPLKDLLKPDTTRIYNQEKVEDRIIEERVVMKLSELKQVYQLFCFYFQLAQQNILSETSRKLVDNYGFEICYEKRILLEEPENNLDQWSNCQQYFKQSVIQEFDKIDEILPNKYNVSLPHFLQLLDKKNGNDNNSNKVQENKFPELKQVSPGIIKASNNLVLSQKQGSIKVINNQLIDFLRLKCGDDYIGIQYGKGELKQSGWYKQLMKNTNIFYQQLLFMTDSLWDFLRYLVQNFLFGFTPMFLILLPLIYLFISFYEDNKTYERRKIVIQQNQQTHINFYQDLHGQDLFTYIFFITQGSFFISFYSGQYFKIASLRRIGQKLKLQNLQTYDEMKIKNFSRSFIQKMQFPIDIIFIIFFPAIIIVLGNLSLVLIFAGSILVPNVMLPMATIMFALVTIIYLQVNSYRQLEDKGKKELKIRFKNNILSKFKENKQQELIKLENQEKQQFNSSLNPSPNKLINPQEIPVDEELIFPRSIKEWDLMKKDPEYHDLRDLEEIFFSIDTNKDDLVDIKEIFEKFKEVDLSISPQQLDEMVASAKSAYLPNTSVFKLGNPNNFKLNKKELCAAIEYLIEAKVKSAMYILKISLYDLILMILYMLFQSTIAACFIYSVFKGFSTDDTPLILGTQNIASLIGFLGIFYTKRIDQSKKIEDKKIMNGVIQEVEDMVHQNNPQTYDNFKNEEVLQPQTPCSPINQVEDNMLQTEQIQLLIRSESDQKGEIELQTFPS